MNLLSRIERACDGLALDVGLYAVSFGFALVTAYTSTLVPHRAWGAVAAWTYLAACLLSAVLLVARRSLSHASSSAPSTSSSPSAAPTSPPPLPTSASSSSSPSSASPSPSASLPSGVGGSLQAMFGGVGRMVELRLWLAWATFAGVALAPLIAQAVQRAGGRTDRAQEEVLVVEHMGERLIDSGTPYLGPDAITALPPGEQLMGYSPYQPGMAIFGIPRAVFGDVWWTDSRVWFAVGTIAALAVAFRLVTAPGRSAQVTSALSAPAWESSPSAPAVPDRSTAAALESGPLARTSWAGGLPVRALQAATVLPICALTLATGGDDLPVLALCLLALAFCAATRYAAAGLAVGAAAALKLFALPVVIVLAVLAIATGHGRRFLPGALGLPVLVLIPAFLVDANAFIENVIRFPLGHGIVTSPAQSPFPGYLIASAVPGGRYVAVGLLVAVGAAIGVRLLLRPPRTATAAALYCGLGLLAAILLMPTTRFGYLLYPIALLVWAATFRPLDRDPSTADLRPPTTRNTVTS